jgi:3-keto-L-gulonate-6-phosphate decarboxylase
LIKSLSEGSWDILWDHSGVDSQAEVAWLEEAYEAEIEQLRRAGCEVSIAWGLHVAYE